MSGIEHFPGIDGLPSHFLDFGFPFAVPVSENIR